MIALTHAWGFSREPFLPDITVAELYPLPGLQAFLQRFQYATAHGLATLITEEVGSGKSTSLRAAAAQLNPSQYRLLSVVATSGSFLEMLRQVCLQLGAPPVTNSVARLLAVLRDCLADISAKKQIPLLLLDEAHLMRLEVFAEMHTLAQQDFDSRALLPMVLSGQNSLVDKLLFHTSRPFSSRIVGRTHLEALQRDHMAAYLIHHLKIAGGKEELLSEEAITAIHQSSGGLLRGAGNLARGALLAAAQEKCPRVSGEHVRIASTEIL
jgi:type II secretory pathway predicted ATPase ExeA